MSETATGWVPEDDFAARLLLARKEAGLTVKEAALRGADRPDGEVGVLTEPTSRPQTAAYGDRQITRLGRTS